MQIALIGFSKSGKTTVFNALTGAGEEVSAYSGGKAKTHRATVLVPDSRLDRLSDMFESKKLVHAAIDYLDPVGIRRDQAGQGGALGEDMLNTISTADALVAVIRDFEDASGVDCDPEGDFEAINLELVLHDLTIVDNRLERVDAQAKRIGGPQRDALLVESAVLNRLKVVLEEGQPIRTLEFTPDEERILSSFQFLTRLMLLTVVNAGADRVEGAEQRIAKMREAAGIKEDEANPATYFMTLCGETEMEIAQLDEADRLEFLEEYGIKEPGMSRMIQLSYEALGLISFHTVGPKEAHAWTLKRGLPVVEAAGVIHSDLQRGFIRAQVVNWQDLLEAGSMAEAKKKAVLRVEGKEYVVQDGDAIEVMFSV